MNKERKKLRLSRETLRMVSLRSAHGGAQAMSIGCPTWGCTSIDRQGCHTFDVCETYDTCLAL